MAGELSGAAQGAAIGTTIMPGWGTAIGAVAGAFMGGTSGGSASGGGASATPQATQAAVFGSGLDGSGWQVILGNNNNATLDNRQDKTIRSEGPIASANPSAGAKSPYGSYYDDPYASGGLGLDSLGLGGVPPIVWLVLFGAVAWKLSKSKK
ncbi:hypothetical protein [Variovorax sp. RCC_210]|uniref:hypothetical protein n=1 Tax=Variovorax sp. RCC_210 TaxID=3239217 RepID=UPI003525274E